MRWVICLFVSCFAMLFSDSQDVRIQDALSRLNAYTAVQEQMNIQDADLAYGMRQALEMAELLISSEGHLDPSMGSRVANALITAPILEYELNMREVLEKLDATWIDFFDQITAPQEEALQSQLALRALFRLKHDEVLTDRHARVAVLSAMLAPYNQGPVGNCFAVAAMLRHHEDYFRHAATDYAALVMRGYLTRTVDQEVEYFFFVPTLADGDREKTFSLSQKGDLWSFPGFVAARTLMQADDKACPMDEVIADLWGNAKATNLKTTPEAVIDAMAHVVARHTGQSEEDLIMWGRYGFSSLTNNPVLRGVETAFSTMAEDSIDDSVRSQIARAINAGLQPVWNLFSKEVSMPALRNQLLLEIDHQYYLIYNADIHIQGASGDGRLTEGGFQMVFVGNPVTSMGAPIQTPQDLRTLILLSIEQVFSRPGLPATAATIGRSLKAHVASDSFLKTVLWSYDSDNQREADPVTHYQNLYRTPMQTCDGNNPFAVNEVDTGWSGEEGLLTYQPKDTRDLLSWCLGLVPQASADFVPMNSPQHAFNFAPKNPDLLKFVRSGLSASQWIQQAIVKPGMQLASSPIAASEKTLLSSTMKSVLSEVLPNPQKYNELVKTIGRNTLSIQTYAQKLLNGIYKLIPFNAAQKEEVAIILDAVLIESLTDAHRLLLGNSAVSFAFTNWNDGPKNIYFCAYLNPRTGRLSFGSILEDKTGLSPMDEREWVNNQWWDVNLNPISPDEIAG